MKKIIKLLISFSLILTCGCSKTKEKVTILYTNDVHTYVNNTKTDENGNETMLLNYASVKALKDELTSQGENVYLVDIGDNLQGTVYGAYDAGESVINLMNETGYNLSAIGNHEFDYGMERFLNASKEAQFDYISCNFYNTQTNETVFEPYKIVEIGGNKIAFIGISTPETIYKAATVIFEDGDGNKLYNFYGGADGKELYDAVQKTIDEVKDKVDYVIALGHLGVDISSAPYRSTDVIENTHGIDVFLDGHSHTVMENEIVQDNEGNDVILSQTGSYLNAIGKLEIDTDGNITTTLITEYDNYDEEVLASTNTFVEEVNATLGEKVATLSSSLYLIDPDTGLRITRNSEANSGDFVADAFYYYFNEINDLDCDVALLNGGGIRSNVEAGDFSYLSAKSLFPFGNVACVIETTGQELLDILEYGSRMVGVIDPATGKEAEVGGFMQVAGIKFTIDTSITSTVQYNDEKTWTGSPTGQYRVSDVEVYNKETGTYEPLDLNKTYRIAGNNYNLRNNGDGYSMLVDNEVVQDYVLEDYLILVEYAYTFEKGSDGYPLISSATSPLNAYTNYLINYENVHGSGRITIK